jgi:hypothetical protein
VYRGRSTRIFVISFNIFTICLGTKDAFILHIRCHCTSEKLVEFISHHES